MRCVLVFCVLFLACSSPQSSTPAAPDAPSLAPTPTAAVDLPAVVVEADWLAQHLDSVRVIDVRGPRSYQEGHIPGAVNMAASTLNEGRDLAADEAVVAAFSQAGISRDFTVVVYGSHEDYRPPARTLWALELFGHERVAVLNGGLEGWTASGHPSETELSVAEPALFSPAKRPELHASTDDVVAAAQDPKVTLIDSRGASDYSGESGKRFAPRHGHIPTAVNVASSSMLIDADGIQRIPDAEALAAAYDGHLNTGQAVTYCNGGNAASLGYLELRLLGVDVAMYDGSWGAWSNQSELPMTTGAEPGTWPNDTQP